MTARIHVGDCLSLLATLEEWSIDAVVTDPPYELGFMGKAWDASGIAYSVDLWRAVFRVLKPGAHLLAFGGTRTYHRMACAIEDAGFEIRDSLQWIYGTGFPKSLNLGDGRGTALKPGHEPIVMARKPLAGTVAANVQRYGTGALNIDATRLGREPGDVSGWSKTGSGESDNRAMSGKNYPREPKPDASGRWPANVIFDEDAARELDAQSGERTSGAWNGELTGGAGAVGHLAGKAARPLFREAESGGASRFFYVAKPARFERDIGLHDLEPASAGEATGRSDGTDGLKSPRAGAGRTGGARNIHPTVKPVTLMEWLCRLVTPKGGTVLDPFTGSGTTGAAAVREGFDFIGMELDAHYAAIAERRITLAANAPKGKDLGKLTREPGVLPGQLKMFGGDR